MVTKSNTNVAFHLLPISLDCLRIETASLKRVLVACMKFPLQFAMTTRHFFVIPREGLQTALLDSQVPFKS